MKCELVGVMQGCWSQMIQHGRAWFKASINGHHETFPMPQEWLDKMPDAGLKVRITITIETIE